MSNNAISQSEDSSADALPLPGNPPAPINIWLVDDNRPLRTTLMEILAKCEGLQCTATFHSPNAVLSTLASKAGPDVILLDIQMGEASGLDAIRPIKALSRSTQVLMFTSCFDNESKRRALMAGASGFLLKHFPLERILDSIHHASRNPAPHLRQPQRQNRAAGPAAISLPPRRPKKRLQWLKHCLDLFHSCRNRNATG